MHRVQSVRWTDLLHEAIGSMPGHDPYRKQVVRHTKSSQMRMPWTSTRAALCHHNLGDGTGGHRRTAGSETVKASRGTLGR